MSAYRAKITTKGQVTIPIDARRALGLEDGDLIALEVKGDYAVIRREKSSVEIVEELSERHRGLAARYASDDAAVGAYFAEDYREEQAPAGEVLELRFPSSILEDR